MLTNIHQRSKRQSGQVRKGRGSSIPSSTQTGALNLERKPMGQLYARVFLQILDSSLANDYQARHVFEDLLKLADDGIVDMTRDALCRRTNIPRDVIDRALAILESPDPASRDPEEDGRRLMRLDDHRDWGWRITNWEKYEAIRNAEDQRRKTAERARRYRARKSPSTPPPKEAEAASDTDTEDALRKRDASLRSVTQGGRFVEPTASELEQYANDIRLPMSEVEAFVDYYRSNGWKVGRNPMKNWRAAMSNWRRHWEQRRGGSQADKEEQERERVRRALDAIKP